MAQSSLTGERLRELLEYSPQTGEWIWVNPQSNRVKAGQIAGVIAVNGRRYIAVDGERHLAHRLSWFWVYGVWPEGNVAPHNGDYLDLRIDNLKEESFADTARKGGGKRTGVSGIPGVSWDATRAQWVATANRDYRPFRLGRFNTKEEAAAAVAASGGVHFEVPKEERVAKASAAATRRRQRLLWERTQKDSGGVTGWSSIEQFIQDVGSVPIAGQIVVAIDTSMMIGPGNFVWQKRAEFDHTSRDGRMAYGKAHRKANPMLYRARELRKNFGIEVSEYLRMLNDQTGVCAICSRSEDVVRNSKRQWLSVDHNHTTGALRGLLCTNCNVAVGMLCDDPSILRRAADYLDRYGDGRPVWSTPSLTEITHLPIGQHILTEHAGYG